jgi:hypothetical protein
MVSSAPASGFSTIGAASGSATAPVKEGSRFAKLLAATTEKAAGGQQDSAAAPGTTDGINTNSQAQSGVNKRNVLIFADQEYLDFHTQVNDLVNNGAIKSGQHREASRYLQNLLDTARGDERFLGNGETNSYFSAIDGCIKQLDRLAKGKRNQEPTEHLRILTARTRTIWV